MLTKDLERALNEHLGAELYAAHLYLAMSAYLESLNLPGAAQWMRIQAQEENGHAMRFYRYVVDRGGRVTIGPIDGPPSDFGSPLGAFEQALEHERAVSERIQKLHALATDQQDYATQSFLQWFVNEQVQEEAAASKIVEDLRMIGGDKPALLMLDRELGARQGAEP